MGYGWTAGLHVEHVDDGYLVLVPGADQILHLTGEQAEAFEMARYGTSAMPQRLQPATVVLAEHGVLEGDGFTRRTMLQVGAAAGAGAVAAIALPSIAAAASNPPTSSVDPPTPGNLIANPSFEDGAPYASVPSWTIG